MKTCPKCRKTKRLSQFGKDRSRRDGRTIWCKDCRNAQSREWRKKNTTDETRARNAKWSRERRKNPEVRAHNAEQKREWRKAHPPTDEQRAYDTERKREWRRDPEVRVRNAKRKRKWRKAHPPTDEQRARKTERMREWYKKNPGKRRVYEATRRAKARGNGGSFTAKEWTVLCRRHDDHCLRCGKKKSLTADHVIPLSKGGSNDISNIQPLCQSCNSIKHDKTTDYR